MANPALRIRSGICHGFSRLLTRPSRHLPALHMSSKSKQPSEMDMPSMDKPVEYSKSKAHQWKSQDTFIQPRKEAPWYQPPVIIASISAMLIYFCILREENDLDRELEKSIFERIPGLEEKTFQGRENYLRQMAEKSSAN